MVAEKVINVFSMIVVVAGVAVVVTSPQMVNIIRAFGDAFAGSIDAAQKV